MATNPRSKFFAQPPSHIGLKKLWAHFVLFVKRFGYLLWQILMPFEVQPRDIADFPDSPSDANVGDSLVKECQWIFDQAEQRRNALEQKAQSTFSLMVFLVPLLTSAFLYIISKTASGTTRWTVLCLVCAAGCFLLLGFISAIRAVGVKTNQTLSLDAVLEDDGSFKTYKEAVHAKGLLHCASMNTAMNDHLAQFVRGAHAMTATALLLLLAASVPEALATMRPAPDTATQVKVIAPVEVFTRAPSGTSTSSPDSQEQLRIKAIEARVAALERTRSKNGHHSAKK
ncbi:MAG: hypothetical protein JST61_09805 [Acidobacteria bacterium]|nr:hypothetical protein [Acidobacteriota bacterium]